MKKNVVFIALIVCLIMLSVPLSSDLGGSTAHAKAVTTAPTISVSPKYLQSTGGGIPIGCTQLNYGYYYACAVSLTVTSAPKGVSVLKWVAYRTSTQCIYNVCTPDYDTAVLPSQGQANTAYSASATIIVSDYCYHGYTNATFTFVVPGTSAAAKVKYLCNMA
jgi:hypothetical protein